ncbi:uncharacterized protein EURHEDRAFT_385645, partial [Aspergillus ruber CBS 135680]
SSLNYLLFYYLFQYNSGSFDHHSSYPHTPSSSRNSQHSYAHKYSVLLSHFTISLSLLLLLLLLPSTSSSQSIQISTPTTRVARDFSCCAPNPHKKVNTSSSPPKSVKAGDLIKPSFQPRPCRLALPSKCICRH